MQVVPLEPCGGRDAQNGNAEVGDPPLGAAKTRDNGSGHGGRRARPGGPARQFRHRGAVSRQPRDAAPAGHRLDRAAPLLVEARRSIRRMLGTRPRPKAALMLADCGPCWPHWARVWRGSATEPSCLLASSGPSGGRSWWGWMWRLPAQVCGCASSPARPMLAAPADGRSGAENRSAVPAGGSLGPDRLPAPGDRVVALVVRRTAIAAQHAAGVPANVAQAPAADLASHFLRLGFVTEAALAGAIPWEIMQ